MQMSLVPLVMQGGSDALVGRVRQVLNVPGGNTLDYELSEMIRGIQRNQDIPPHGCLDERTLAVFDITPY
jgi:hypothetical protein